MAKRGMRSRRRSGIASTMPSMGIKQEEKLALDVLSEQNLIESMERQRQNLESEAFSKAAALRTARGSPF